MCLKGHGGEINMVWEEKITFKAFACSHKTLEFSDIFHSEKS